MSKPPLRVVGGVATPPPPPPPPVPATFDEALAMAFVRAKAAGAVTFLFAWQVGDEPPAAMAFPDTASIRRGLSNDVFNAVHYPDGQEIEVTYVPE